MASLMASFVSEFVQVFKDYPNGDPRMDGYFLMKSLKLVVFIILFYVTFVTIIGPRLMKNRQPFNLRNFMIAYNLFQILINTLLFFQLVLLLPDLNVICTKIDRSSSPKNLYTLKLHYYYLCLKFFDFLDTVFFVLRKKDNQITFLHVYHHVCIFFGAWLAGKYFPAGHGLYTAMLNTLVHAVMYFYYFLTSLDPAYGKVIWWKKYLTILQIVQHYVILALYVGPVLDTNCNYPKVCTVIYCINLIVMIYLFSKFYKKNYGNKKVE